MRRIFLISVLLFSKLFSQTPTADCFSSTFKICDTTTLFLMDITGYPNPWGNVHDLQPPNNISNPNINPASSNSGCLLSGEQRPTWATFEVLIGGTFGFSYGHSGGQMGFNDWIVWPYDTSTCNKIKNNLLSPVRCNWNNSNNGGTGIGVVPLGADPANYEPVMNVNTGDKFIMCINDYAGTGIPKMKFMKTGTCVLNCGMATNIHPNKDNNSVNVYPNPADHLLNIKSADIRMALIYDCIGDLVLKANENEVKHGINVSQLTNGVYFIELLESNGQKSSKKIMIEH